MKSFVKIAVAGISGVVLFKLFATILFPVLGMMLGLIALTVKLALIAAVVFFIYSMLKKRDEKDGAEGEIVVEDEESEG
jgi:hypothetical protein